MGEFMGRINVPKDTMLFVVNSVFKRGIKQSTTKEDILKMIPEIYEQEDAKEIIKLLPYKTYLVVKDLVEYLKTNDDIEDFLTGMTYEVEKYLEEAMIIVMRAKRLNCNYSLNPGVVEKLTKIFSEENILLAEKYGRIERLTIGMLYYYGVVEFEFLRNQICKFIGEDVSKEELFDLYFKRLNLNLIVRSYNVRWKDTNEEQEFLTYLDENEIDVGAIVGEQKARGLKYKEFEEQELLDRDEFWWDDLTKKLYEFVKSKNEEVWKYPFEAVIKRNELGEDISTNLMRKCIFERKEEITEFMKIYIEWHNNSPQYILGGYSPNEFAK